MNFPSYTKQQIWYVWNDMKKWAEAEVSLKEQNLRYRFVNLILLLKQGKNLWYFYDVLKSGGVMAAMPYITLHIVLNV